MGTEDMAVLRRCLAEDKTLNFELQVAELCIVASEERVGISLDHPLSNLAYLDSAGDIMLDHRKKRVKRAAKATLRELVPALYEARFCDMSRVLGQFLSAECILRSVTEIVVLEFNVGFLHEGQQSSPL
ncbi:hypothetical protein AK812_SmicGene17822 [Symbiodinium microadriaticum]|uniref:Uncharacterized protein n=1 Tax=Symbiodinium microadriaticum TaxID=2951 RepID=A0A1Q9DWP7_SYMMI|nr:hypothetical protein AK812_SmicGene17822 [Symbiodinium microadriaticum]